MAHIIILGKNRDLLRTAADASVELAEIHEAVEAMPSGTQKTTAMAAVDNLADALNDFNSDFAGHIATIKAICGI